MMKPLKYRYVVFSTLDIESREYVHIMYNDLQGKDNILFIDSPFDNCKNKKFYQTLHKLHYHGNLNKYFEFPLKSLWNHFYFHEKLDDKQQLCFVFFISSLRKENESFFKYLKKQYPGCKLVIYFEDIIASRGKEGGNILRLDYIDKYFDLALSYDKVDSEKYGFLYYPTPYSVIVIKDNPYIPQSDLFFCGAAKQRYDMIVDVYKKCIDKDTKCDFIIARADGNEKIDGMSYVSYMLPYSEYLEHMKKTNCLLEIIQEGSTGYTLRVWEALVYGKKLLTNNKNIINAPFYDEKQFRYFSEIGDMEIEFINQKQELTPRYREELSPLRLIECIDKNL